MKKFCSHMFIFMFIFIFIYSPRLIFKYDPIIILTVLSIMNIFIFYKQNIVNIILNKKIFTFIVGILITIVYLSARISSSYNFILIYRIIVILVQVLPCSIYLCLYLKKNNYTFEKVCDLLIKVSFFQSIISILMFVNSSFRGLILNLLIKNGLFNFMLDKNIFEYIANRRIYGITTSYTFSMPVLQGFIAVIALIMGIKYSIKYFLYIPFILFSAAVNARTGLLVFVVIGLISLILFKENNVKKFMKISIMGLIMVVGFNIFSSLIQGNSIETYKWIIDAKKETIDLILGKQGSKLSTYKVLEDMFFLPEGTELIFGTGFDVFDLKSSTYGKTSDIGYVNDIFIGGLIFVIIFYGTIIKLGLSLLDKNSFEKKISILMVLTLLLINIKGAIISKNEFLNVYILISVAMIIFSESQNRCKYRGTE